MVVILIFLFGSLFDVKAKSYAESSLDFMIEKPIDHVDKFDKPANLPEVTPIEDFWTMLKGKVYEMARKKLHCPN